jgi:UDP-N-acetylglucosamine 1-carboxyvinyltransferase
MKYRKCLKIVGNRAVNGVVKVSGSKNAALPLIAASLFIKGKTILNNVPDIEDVRNLLKILSYLNVDYTFKENRLVLDTTNIERKNLDIEEVNKFRASYYLIPFLIEENKSLIFSGVGGCNFENRPIDIHLDILKRVGVKISYGNGKYKFDTLSFKELDYRFLKKSLGATINSILLGLRTQKQINICNYSNEPEVIDVIHFLNKAGLDINVNDDNISFMLKTPLNSIEYDVMPDRIEAETFALIGLGLGRIGIFDFIKKDHVAFLNFLDKYKIVYTLEDNFLLINQEKIKVDEAIKLDCFPNFSTDIGPILLSYLLLNSSMFIIRDHIYKKRLYNLLFYRSSYYFQNDNLVVNPLLINKENHEFYGTNLRDTMAYLYYCLTHEGYYTLYGLEHLERGYENLIDKLISLNCIVEIEDEN